MNKLNFYSFIARLHQFAYFAYLMDIITLVAWVGVVPIILEPSLLYFVTKEEEILIGS